MHVDTMMPSSVKQHHTVVQCNIQTTAILRVWHKI